MMPKLIANYACHIGENPLWHPIEEQLYWTDIPTGRLFRFDPVSCKHAQIYTGRPVGGFTFNDDGGLVLFMDRGTITFWRNGELTELLAEIPDELDSRFNDVFADPHGRVFCGTMSTESHKGRLYRLDTDGSLHLILENIGCSNGMALSPDGLTFFYTDSFARQIYRFTFDESTGSIRDQSVFTTFTEAEGLPDGMAIDSEGRIWCAMWEGGCICRLHQNGSVAERHALPVQKVTSLAFGGNTLSDLYITTAGADDLNANGLLAGSLFKIESSVTGLLENLSRTNQRRISLAKSNFPL